MTSVGDQGGWRLPSLHDYFAFDEDALAQQSQRLAGLGSGDRRAALLVVEETVAAQALALDDELLPQAAVSFVDDLYRSGCALAEWGQSQRSYVAAVWGTFFAVLRSRGFALRYVVMSTFPERLELPLDVFPDLFGLAGVTYACPQEVAMGLLKGVGGERTAADVRSVLDEARVVAASIASRAAGRRGHLVYLELECVEGCLALVDRLPAGPGTILAYRDESGVAAPCVQVAIVPKYVSSWAQMESAARAGDPEAAKQLVDLYDHLRAEGFAPRDRGPWTKDIAMWGGGETLFQLDLVRCSEDGTYYLLWLGEKVAADDDHAAIAAVEARYKGYGARRLAVDRPAVAPALTGKSGSPAAASEATATGFGRHLTRKGYTRRAHGEWTKDVASWGVGHARLDLESVESEAGEGYFRLWLAEIIPADDDATAVAAVEERYIGTDIELVVAAPAEAVEARGIGWYDQPPPDAPATCRSCGWTGRRADLDAEPFEALLERSCPSCGAHIEIVVFPTDDDTRRAAAAGVPEAVAALVGVERRAERSQHPQLQRPEDLPELPANSPRRLDIVLEPHDGDDHWLVVKADADVVWRQPAFWEHVAAGEDLLRALWAGYTDRIDEIQVSPAAQMWLCGDRLSYVARIDAAATRPAGNPDQTEE